MKKMAYKKAFYFFLLIFLLDLPSLYGMDDDEHASSSSRVGASSEESTNEEKPKKTSKRKQKKRTKIKCTPEAKKQWELYQQKKKNKYLEGAAKGGHEKARSLVFEIAEKHYQDACKYHQASQSKTWHKPDKPSQKAWKLYKEAYRLCYLIQDHHPKAQCMLADIQMAKKKLPVALLNNIKIDYNLAASFYKDAEKGDDPVVRERARKKRVDMQTKGMMEDIRELLDKYGISEQGGKFETPAFSLTVNPEWEMLYASMWTKKRAPDSD